MRYLLASLIVLAATAGCGAIYSAGVVSAKTTGRISDEKGAPVKNASVGLYFTDTIGWPGGVVALTAVRTDSSGHFSLDLTHKSRHSNSYFLGTASHNQPKSNCMACKKGYYVSHFECGENASVTLVHFNKNTLDPALADRYRDLHLTKPAENDILTECDLDEQALSRLDAGSSRMLNQRIDR